MSEAPTPVGLAWKRGSGVLLLTQFSGRKLTGPPPCLGSLPYTELAKAFTVGPPVDPVRVARSQWLQHLEGSLGRRPWRSGQCPSPPPSRSGLWGCVDGSNDSVAVLSSYFPRPVLGCAGDTAVTRQPWAMPSGKSGSRWGDTPEWSGLWC